MPALTEFRNVTVTFTGGARPIDAHSAAITQIRAIEEQYAHNPDSVTDLTTQRVVLVGRTPYQVYVFNLTSVKATGTYTYAYVETVPTIEDIS